jgi:hypothetical protein
MLANLLGHTKSISIYKEKNKKAMRNFRIRDDNSIKRLIDEERNDFIVIKPINDSQHADHLLSLYPNAKAIWLYRDYNAVSNSAVKKWQDAQKNIVLWLAENYGKEEFPNNDLTKDCSVYLERIELDTIATIRKVANVNMTQEEGAALLWYIRNKIFFDLALQNDKRVYIIKYENLVTDSEKNMRKLCEHIGCKFSKKTIEKIKTSSVKNEYPFELGSSIEQICKKLLNDLDDQCLNQMPNQE